MTMAKVEDSVTLLLPHKTVWHRLIEFTRWDEWLHIPDAGTKGLGENMRCLGGEGTEMRFGLYSGGVLKQTMKVTEWDPPKRLAMALEGWNWKAIFNEREAKVTPEGRAKMVCNWGALSLAYGADVQPVSDLETKFSFQMEAEFTHSVCGPLFNLVYPLRSQMRRITSDFTARFTQSFERHRAA